LQGGYDCYDNDCVISVEETEDNIYEAEVEGTELYTVEVELDDKANIIDTQCDCPYDMGEYCKHQVAVFVALRDMKNNSPIENSHLPPKNIDSESVHRSLVSKKGKTRENKSFLSMLKEDHPR